MCTMCTMEECVLVQSTAHIHILARGTLYYVPRTMYYGGIAHAILVLLCLLTPKYICTYEYVRVLVHSTHMYLVHSVSNCEFVHLLLHTPYSYLYEVHRRLVYERISSTRQPPRLQWMSLLIDRERIPTGAWSSSKPENPWHYEFDTPNQLDLS